MRAISLFALALGLLLDGVDTPLRAQRVLEVLVVDSLLNAAPIANASVELRGRGVALLTDSSGRVRFSWDGRSGVEVSFTASKLDSLGIGRVQRLVEPGSPTPDTVRLTLAIPAAPTLQLAFCGNRIADSTTVIFGEVRSFGAQPAAGNTVSAWWFSAAESERALVAQQEIHAPTGETGAYSLCGIPSGVEANIKVTGDGQSGTVTIPTTAPFIRLDLIVGGQDDRVDVVGRVLGPTGPLSGATVSHRDEPRLASRTTPDGAFRIASVPAASGELLVKHVGSRPELVRFVPVGNPTLLGDIQLTQSTAILAEVRVSADRMNRERAEFMRRQQGALGTFLPDTLLKAFPRVTLNAVASLVPRVSVLSQGPLQVLRLRQGPGWCNPRFFVDGAPQGRLDRPEDIPEQEMLIERAVRIEIYTAAQAPPQFNDFDGCGAVVIWTR